MRTFIFILLFLMAINFSACTNKTIKKSNEVSLQAKLDSIKNAFSFTITGRLNTQNGNIDGSKIRVYDLGNDSLISKLDDTAKFHFRFKRDKTYRADFSKSGYYTKQILIETQVPDSIKTNFPSLSFIVNLFEFNLADSTNQSQLVGRVYFNPQIDNFDTEIFFN